MRGVYLYFMITIKETSRSELPYVKNLWADGDVMKFVGFPDGLHETEEEMNEWYNWVLSSRPMVNHYSIFEDDVYCGETFFRLIMSKIIVLC